MINRNFDTVDRIGSKSINKKKIEILNTQSVRDIQIKIFKLFDRLH